MDTLCCSNIMNNYNIGIEGIVPIVHNAGGPVNMNAADDKENKSKSKNINGVNSEAAACSSTMCTENSEKIIPQVKLNGSSSQNSDCNKLPITKGAYSKLNSISCNVTTYENGGPSDSIKNSSTQTSSGKSENVYNEINWLEGENSLLYKNSIELHPGKDDHLVNIHTQPKLNDRVTCDYDKNSSSEDEECCIYTYKGDANQMADLPSSFFRLDLMMPSRPNANSRNSSPDMDYLEMDFDPGPSNDRYNSSDSECGDIREDEEQVAVAVSLLPKPQADCESVVEPAVEPEANPPTPLSPLSTPSPVSCPRPQSSTEQSYPSGFAWSPPSSPYRQPTEQDDSETLQPSYCYCIANKFTPISIDENFNEGDSGTMVWKEQEAKEKQVTQISISACGATAVINALLGLNVPFSGSTVKQYVATRLRSDSAPVVEYLLSRCNAGATHVDMIRGLQGASQDLVYARFFHMYPQRSISLTSWLSHWIRKGAVPIATLNLQRGVRVGVEVPDMWHHQMIHGVGAGGVYLTNPLEVQSETRLWQQLASPSLLLVRRDDILSRWTPDTSLHPLISTTLPLWRKMNVLGQVVNVIREGNTSSHCTQHITIPASYSSGITLAVLRTSPAYDELRFAPELPVDPFASR